MAGQTHTLSCEKEIRAILRRPCARNGRGGRLSQASAGFLPRRLTIFFGPAPTTWRAAGAFLEKNNL